MMNAIHPMPRRGRFTAGMLLGLTFLAGGAQAQDGGSIKAGREATQTCAGCHGAKGNSATPAFPSLAGQPARYIAAQLTAYRGGKRENAIMNGQATLMMPIAAKLSDEEIAALATHIATLD